MRLHITPLIHVEWSATKRCNCIHHNQTLIPVKRKISKYPKPKSVTTRLIENIQLHEVVAYNDCICYCSSPLGRCTNMPEPLIRTYSSVWADTAPVAKVSNTLQGLAHSTCGLAMAHKQYRGTVLPEALDTTSHAMQKRESVHGLRPHASSVESSHSYTSHFIDYNACMDEGYMYVHCHGICSCSICLLHTL